MAKLQLTPNPPAPITVNRDGQATFTLTHDQLLLLETFVAQPKWRKAAKQTAVMFRCMGL